MPKATLILHRKRVFDDGTISEIRLWLVPAPVRGSAHRYRYSLFFGRPGERWVGYDNEPGKGDHRHLGEDEHAYDFVSPAQLMTDYLADVAEARARHKTDGVRK